MFTIAVFCYCSYRYPGTKEINWEKIPETEIIVVFDADMVAKKHFFLRILEPLTDPKYALCLSPQVSLILEPSVLVICFRKWGALAWSQTFHS